MKGMLKEIMNRMYDGENEEVHLSGSRTSWPSWTEPSASSLWSSLQFLAPSPSSWRVTMILNKTTTPFQNIIKTVITIITNITKYPHPNHHNGNLYPHHHHDYDGDNAWLMIMVNHLKNIIWEMGWGFLTTPSWTIVPSLANNPEHRQLSSTLCWTSPLVIFMLSIVIVIEFMLIIILEMMTILISPMRAARSWSAETVLRMRSRDFAAAAMLSALFDSTKLSAPISL